MSLLEKASYVYKLCKEFIEKYCQDESVFFDNIWEIYEPELNRLLDSPPEKWHFRISKYKLMGALGLSDSAQIKELVTPKIIQIIFATLFQLERYEKIPMLKDIEETISNCAIGLPSSIRLKAINYFASLIQQDIRKIKAIPKEEFEEEKKHIMYSHDLKAGKPVTENEVELRTLERDDYILWLDMTKKIVFIKGRKIDFDPLHKRILAYLIKKKGGVANYQELYENFCKWVKDKDKYNEWDESLRGTVYRWFSDIKKIIRMNQELSKEEKDRFRDFIMNEPNDGYRINTELEECKYCLIETRHI